MAFDFGSIIRNIAPMLATTLAAPLGPLAPFAGMAVSSIIAAVSPEAAAQVTQANTEGGVPGAIAKIQDLFQQGVIQTAELKKAELAHSEKMTELGYKNATDLEAIAAGDRDSARKREETVKDRMPAVLAIFIVIAAVIVSCMIISGSAPAMKDPTTAALAGTIVGYIFNEVKSAFSYYFGTTSGSAAAHAAVEDIAKQP